jgi:hypothetical protein
VVVKVTHASAGSHTCAQNHPGVKKATQRGKLPFFQASKRSSLGTYTASFCPPINLEVANGTSEDSSRSGNEAGNGLTAANSLVGR